MFFLGIETSCDETAVAVVRHQDGRTSLIVEEISSQIAIHQQYGGVVPELASREHLRNLPLLVDSLLKKADLDLRQFSAIGVTRGPGLLGCLLVGLNYAQGLGLASNVPVLGISHIEGHLLSPFIDCADLNFPYLALVVSGGHTEIVLVKELGDYEVMARTIDDAAGEAFDKSANLLQLDYPGAAKLAALADGFRKSGHRSQFVLPKVMRDSNDFSFSGLKTAISLLIKRNKDNIDQNLDLKAAIAHTIQEAILDSLLSKLEKAINASGVRSIVVCGGVSANVRLREILMDRSDLQVLFPSALHCMDNAAMIAYVTAQRFLRGERGETSISAISRWPIEDLK